MPTVLALVRLYGVHNIRATDAYMSHDVTVLEHVTSPSGLQGHQGDKSLTLIRKMLLMKEYSKIR